MFSLLSCPSSASDIVSCRGEPGKVEFLDANGQTIKSFINSEKHQRKGELVTNYVMHVYGCLKGKFAYIIRHTSTCAYGDPCDESEMHAKLEIYDHTGKRTWQGDIPIGDSDEVAVARTDERILFASISPPHGIVVIDGRGKRKLLDVKGGLYPNAISPSGRYGVASIGLKKFVFFDAVSGKAHVYEGAGSPWVDDAGKFEVWVGSSLKNDWSLGPDGKKVYDFKFK